MCLLSALGWRSSDVLRRPNILSTTIIIPALLRETNSSVVDDSEQAPIPRAYRRVKEFLKGQLQAELSVEASVRHPLLTKLGNAQAAAGLRQQLMAYARGEWPFNQPFDAYYDGAQPVLHWWQSLADHPHARVLAVSDCIEY